VTTTLQAETSAERDTTADQFRAPLLASVLERVRDEDSWAILDMASARRSNVAFFSDCGCRLAVADLIDQLVAPEELPGSRQALDDYLASLLPPTLAGSLNLVLCWDLPDYLPRPSLAALMRVLAPRMRPDGLVHLFVNYAQPRIPAVPCKHEIQSDGSLLRRPRNTALRAAPRYSMAEVERLMPEFAVERGILLKNGLQENLLRKL